METIVPSSQEHRAMIMEDSSDRSDESSTMSQEYQTRGFEDYDIAKRLKESVGERSSVKNDLPNIPRARDFRLAVGRNDSNLSPRNNSVPFDEISGHECSLNLGKSKKYDFASVQLGDVLNYQTDRIHETEYGTDGSQICGSKDSTMKEAFFNLQTARDKYRAANFERSPKEFNYLVEREIKEYGIAKGYNLSLDRIKEFKLPHERIRENQSNTLSGIERLDDAGTIEASDHRNLHGQTRNSQDLECIVYERMRRSHHHFFNRTDFSGHHMTNSHHSRQTNVTQLQQSQQQQQQIKSFTIDAILAHRNNQNRERYQRSQQQQLRKTARAVRQECQEVTGKSSVCTSRVPNANVNDVVVNSGKAKRVRTIFTAEQLERLEGEFARQQYMVGPERLYLAHALRLTEAQVKVWFQNRRIKWRKVNHEQHCQAASEHRQRCSLPGTLDIHEDESNDTGNASWSGNGTFVSSIPGDDASLIDPTNQQQSDIRDTSILKS